MQVAQRDALLHLLSQVRATNPFYRAKLSGLGTLTSNPSLSELLSQIPFTTKEEIARDQLAHPPYGTNLTFPLSEYVRCHQTSGTSEKPLHWLDTSASWDWMLRNWNRVFASAGVTRDDVIFFAFSFGPFLGFWTAFESASRHLGALCLSGGGLGSAARLRKILEHRATVLCCTPTYAIHLAETALTESISLDSSPVKRILVAGEPGGSIPSVRQRMTTLWPGSQVFDHHGMTEIGPVSYPCSVRPETLHVMESEFIPEVLSSTTGQPVQPGEAGELVLTNLGREGSPLIRYRTGDLVTCPPPDACVCGTLDLALERGVWGRTDDMLVVRGVNLYPSAVDEIIRGVEGIAEYQVCVVGDSALTEISIHIELHHENQKTLVPGKLTRALHDAFLLRFGVQVVERGTLPRFEHKARRWQR